MCGRVRCVWEGQMCGIGRYLGAGHLLILTIHTPHLVHTPQFPVF